MTDKPDLGWVTIPTEEFERLQAEINPHTHQSFVEGCYPCDLLQRLSELRAELERVNKEWREFGIIAREENERLRAALEQIEAGYGQRLSAAELASIARQAL